MKNTHETFASIQEALKHHNESGIVCYDDGNAIICNWACFDGLPAISIFGVIGTGGEIEVIGRRESDSWRRCIEDGIVVRATCGDSAGSVYRQSKDGSWNNVLPMKWENFRRGWNAGKLVIMP